MKTLPLLLLLLFSASSALYACECPPLPPLNKAALGPYNVIFYGRVDSVSPCDTKGMANAYFTIGELYKGEVPKHLKVGFECRSGCLMSFSAGEQWLIYSRFVRFGILKAELCEHSRKLFQDASQDIYFISSQRSFPDEKELLGKLLGTHLPLSIETADKEKQVDMRPHNEQPSPMNKLWLLLISLAVMLLVFVVSKRIKK